MSTVEFRRLPLSASPLPIVKHDRGLDVLPRWSTDITARRQVAGMLTLDSNTPIVHRSAETDALEQSENLELNSRLVRLMDKILHYPL